MKNFNFKLIERKYLIATVVLLIMSLLIFNFYDKTQNSDLTSANNSVLKETAVLKASQDMRSKLNQTGETNITSAQQAVTSYESGVQGKVCKLLFANMLNSFIKTSGVTLQNLKFNNPVAIQPGGLGYYPNEIVIVGGYNNIKTFIQDIEGSAAYLVTIGDITLSTAGVQPLTKQITADITLRTWIDATKPLFATGITSGANCEAASFAPSVANGAAANAATSATGSTSQTTTPKK